MQLSTSSLKLALGLLALSSTANFAFAEDGVHKENKPSKATLEKFDANNDGQLNEEEKAKAKAAAKEKAKHTREENLAKYDTNKDGKLDEAEKVTKKTDEDAAREAKRAEKEAVKATREIDKK